MHAAKGHRNKWDLTPTPCVPEGDREGGELPASSTSWDREPTTGLGLYLAVGITQGRKQQTGKGYNISPRNSPGNLRPIRERTGYASHPLGKPLPCS